MSEPSASQAMRDPYLEWIAAEGLPVAEDFGVDLFQVETRPWARLGANGAAVHLKGRGDFCNMFLYELAPGGASAPQRHLYEEVVCVLAGRGSTAIEVERGRTHSFEWGPGSLFAIPLNARHRHFNGSGAERALLASTTTLPVVLNLFHNPAFVFDNDWHFAERIGKPGYFKGEGEYVALGQNHLWETNFVPDVTDIKLGDYGARGAGGRNLKLILADGTMHAHISEMPVGTYKKAHRHAADFHVMCVTGTGYSLLWYEGQPDWVKVDWKHGTVFAPPDRMFHQHFNTSAVPARYLATAYGSLRYPFTESKRKSLFGGVSTSVKEGGDQIEYADQSPRVHELFVKETAKNGVMVKMAGLI
jgi:quercetin dioxygenase-like cupin family protein